MAEVRDVLREVRLTIGSEGDAGERERQQARVKRMLTAMGVSEDDLDAELREHKQQQEADAAAVPEELQPNGDAHVGVAGGIPQEEGVGQDGDVEMDVEGMAGVDKDVHHGQPGTQICCSHLNARMASRQPVGSLISINSLCRLAEVHTCTQQPCSQGFILLLLSLRLAHVYAACERACFSAF